MIRRAMEKRIVVYVVTFDIRSALSIETVAAKLGGLVIDNRFYINIA